MGTTCDSLAGCVQCTCTVAAACCTRYCNTTGICLIHVIVSPIPNQPASEVLGARSRAKIFCKARNRHFRVIVTHCATQDPQSSPPPAWSSPAAAGSGPAAAAAIVGGCAKGHYCCCCSCCSCHCCCWFAAQPLRFIYKAWPNLNRTPGTITVLAAAQLPEALLCTRECAA